MEKAMLDQIREWLKEGAVIRATDTTGAVLEFQEDGSCLTGLSITFPEK